MPLRGTTRVGDESTVWKAGDVLALPGAPRVEHHADEDAVAWQRQPELGLDDAMDEAAGVERIVAIGRPSRVALM